MDFYSYQQYSQSSPVSTAFVAGLYAENDDEDTATRPTLFQWVLNMTRNCLATSCTLSESYCPTISLRMECDFSTTLDWDAHASINSFFRRAYRGQQRVQGYTGDVLHYT
eukprot:2120278-Pyramimonas_sp.AAC.1